MSNLNERFQLQRYLARKILIISSKRSFIVKVEVLYKVGPNTDEFRQWKRLVKANFPSLSPIANTFAHAHPRHTLFLFKVPEPRAPRLGRRLLD